MQERQRRRKELGLFLLGGCCNICNTDKNLQFDHINPATKWKPVSELYTHSLPIFLKELAKCQLLCRIHHLEKSRLNGELGGGQNKISIENAKHGTSVMYYKFKCKCVKCKEYKKLSRKS